MATLFAGLTPINDRRKLSPRDIWILFYSGDNKATVRSFYENCTFKKCISDYDIIQNKSFLYSKSFEFVMQNNIMQNLYTFFPCVLMYNFMA